MSRPSVDCRQQHGTRRPDKRHQGQQCQSCPAFRQCSCRPTSVYWFWGVCIEPGRALSYLPNVLQIHVSCLCSFSGSKQVPDSTPSLQDTPSSSITNLPTDAQAAIDSETLLHLKRLSKRDPTTKQKALQASMHACHLQCMPGMLLPVTHFQCSDSPLIQLQLKSLSSYCTLHCQPSQSLNFGNCCSCLVCLI